MPAKKAPLTLNEHRAMGDTLIARSREFANLWVSLSGRYGTTHKAPKAAKRAMDAVDELRNQLDSQLCRDLPDDFDPAIYYGARESSED
ncbi:MULTISPECIES: hypothetical protein [unclassified Frankia]|uniref:hypothetical protein n=1 Tax=unclassified Frankia TaxID=2632575 RepID=UPI001EF48544|nr:MULTISPECIES: hypothetical protein [unclassified Frankia]